MRTNLCNDYELYEEDAIEIRRIQEERLFNIRSRANYRNKFSHGRLNAKPRYSAEFKRNKARRKTRYDNK